jgi:excisionase family DNA binding protein
MEERARLGRFTRQELGSQLSNLARTSENTEEGGAMNGTERRQRRNDNNNSMGAMLTMREACELLNVHGNTLRRWSTLGLIQAYRVGIGQHRRFRAEDVAALVVEHTRFGSNDPEKH